MNTARDLVLALLGNNPQADPYLAPTMKPPASKTDYPMEEIAGGLKSGPNTVMFDKGAPDRIREALGTTGLPGNVSQMPATAPDGDYEDNYLSVILPPMQYLKYKLQKNKINAERDVAMGNRQANLLRILAQTEHADTMNKLADIRLGKIEKQEQDEQKNEKVNMLHAYLTSTPEYADLVKGMTPGMSIFRARDIALQARDEKLAELYNNAVKFFPELDPIEMEDIRSSQQAAIHKENMQKMADIEAWINEPEKFMGIFPLGQKMFNPLDWTSHPNFPDIYKMRKSDEDVFGPGTLKYLERLQQGR